MSSRPFALLLCALAVTTACEGPLQRAARLDTEAGWRAYLAEAPTANDAERTRAKRRLEEVVWRDALGAGDIGGLNRYLDLYPNGRHRAEASARLAELRLKAALARDDTWGLEELIRRHPGTPEAREATRVLAARSREAALAAQEAAALEAWLQRFPGAAGETSVRTALAELRVAEALQGRDRRAAQRYLAGEPGPEGELRVRDLLRSMEVEALSWEGNAQEAEALIASVGDPTRQAPLRALADRVHLERALARADLRALRGRSEPAALEGTRALERMGPKRAAALARALGGEPGLPARLLEAGARDRDPRRRRMSLRALSFGRVAGAIPALIAGVRDSDPSVQLEAVEGLRRLSDSLPPPLARQRLLDVLEGLEGRMAAGSALQGVEAAVFEALGERERARAAWRGAASAPDHLIGARTRAVALLPSGPDRRAALGQLLQALIPAATESIEALGALSKAPRLNVSALRRAESLAERLRWAVGEGQGSPAAPASLGRAEATLRALEARLGDAWARAKVLGVGWVPWDHDEAAAGRAIFVSEASAALAGALAAQPAGPWLEALRADCARSPFPALAQLCAAPAVEAR